MVIVKKINNRNFKNALETIIDHYAPNFKNKVLIKPNWGGRIPIIKGENTDSYFLKTITEIIAERNVKKIYVAHFSLLKVEKEDYSFEKLLKIVKIDKIKFPHNVEFLNLDGVEKECFNIDGFSFHLPKMLDEVYYLNLSKLKTHIETKISLCLKNQMGMLPSEDKINMHRKGLEKGIALLATRLMPDLCIIDGIISMDKNGPHHGRTRKTNIVICSDNLIEADSLGSYLMGYNPQDVKHINFAIALGVGNRLTAEIMDKYRQYRLNDFVLPQEYTKKFNLIIWPTTACSQCIFNLDNAKQYLKKDLILLMKLLLNKKKFNIVIGNGKVNEIESSKIIAIGECVKALAKEKNINYLSGCPPSSKKIYEFLKENIF